MSIPLLSLADPLIQAEGSIDPLGMAAIADSLADAVLPALTARMWRPRFLTAIAAASVVAECFAEQVAADGVSPPYLVLEWYAVEAFARAEKETGKGAQRVPGIDKARSAMREGVPLSTRRYLKTASIFGFHGVYKTLGRALDIIDSELILGGQGYELLQVWEKEQRLSGFALSESGEGAFTRRQLRRAVADGLRLGHTVENSRWRFFPKFLHPDQIGKAEGELIWRLILSPEGGTRGEVFDLLQRSEVRAVANGAEEADFMRWLQRQASEDLRRRLHAIDAFEGVCRMLQDGFDRLRHLSSVAGAKAVNARDFARRGGAQSVKRLTSAFRRAEDALEGTGREQAFASLAKSFDGVINAERFYHSLLERHEDVQRAKPPDGKRPWFERTCDEGVVIRPPYRLPLWHGESTGYVHRYRMRNVIWFIDDLKVGQ